MQIQQVIFNSPNIAAQQHFFEQTLGFTVESLADDRLTIQAGTSKGS